MDFPKLPQAGTAELVFYTALITGVVGIIMGVFGKAAAEWLLKKILCPIHWITESTYHWIAPRNPFSIALKSYKNHILRSKLSQLENPLGPENLLVPLENAFVPLKLVSSDLQQDIDLFTYVASNCRSMVLGGPGTGKTTLMKSLVTGIIKPRCHPELDKLIPVFIVLRNLARNQHTVKDAIVSAFADYHFPGAEHFIKSALNQGKMVIILDGLDEVGSNRDFVVRQIQEFCEYDDQQEHRNRILVTCREHAYETKDLHASIQQIVRVEPFANHHMRMFLNGWPEHKGRNAVNLYALIQADPQIRDICRNPLLLTLLTGLYLDATDDFKLPTSRSQFYKSAIEELLIQRPARRQMKQTYHPDDKRQILERVALEHLETVHDHEDTEEFSDAAIKQKAIEVIGSDKFDCRELIKEMVEINGIIKPTQDGHYTCAHRTIQEYLAAREAGRTRTTDEVVNRFSERLDLIQVLYFYCGQINNIPALTGIVQKFADELRWPEAGRCLLNARQITNSTLVDTVADGLANQISTQSDFKLPLEILASLAQRSDSAFDMVKTLFSSTIDSLAAQNELGASALGSVLAASPELAMKVIPSLLQHHSERWKVVALQLLRDIGTDEALDKLVQLLRDSDSFIREQAAYFLTSIMGNRNTDLIQRVTLLPECSDVSVWPLNDYFPARLAIPIAEALVNINLPVNDAIYGAIQVVRARNNYSVDQALLRRWSNLRRDLSIRDFCFAAKRVFHRVAIGLTLIVIFVVLGLAMVSKLESKLFIVDLKTSNIYQIDSAWAEKVQTLATDLVIKIEASYPPNAEGLSRILPWNWYVEPLLPNEQQAQAFEFIKEGSRENNIVFYRFLNNFGLTSVIGEMNEPIKNNYNELQKSVTELKDQSLALSSDLYLMTTNMNWWVVPYLFSLSLIFPIWFYFIFWQRLRKTFNYIVEYIILVYMPILLVCVVIVVQGSLLVTAIPIVLIAFFDIIGLIIIKTSWANNTLIDDISDIIKLRPDKSMGSDSILPL